MACVRVLFLVQKVKDSEVQYKLSRRPLNGANQQWGLGAILVKTLNTNLQSTKAAKSANSIIRTIKASSSSSSLSHRDFPHNKWNGYPLFTWNAFSKPGGRGWKNDIRILGNIQRGTTKFVNGLRANAYEERRRILTVDSWCYRLESGGGLLLVY